MSGRRVVILGGGMGGLATAWRLSSGPWRDRFESITVYQRGWRLGGKGASSRGNHGRIEEHGLHLLLGYYDSTFRLLREVYAELDRPRSDPGCPIKTWREAVAPAGDVGLAGSAGSGWDTFVTRFSTNDRIPGEPGAEDAPLRPIDLAVRGLRLLADFHESLIGTDDRVYLSNSPVPRRRAATLPRAIAATALAGVLVAMNRLANAAEVTGAARRLAAWRDSVRQLALADRHTRETWLLVDLVAANLQGMLADRLTTPEAFQRIDHLDYRAWLRGHGADEETLDSPIVRGMYALTFAYEGGDRSRPAFAAGLGLQLAMRMLFDFKGSIFWRMTAGMGEVVFAPLYQVLRDRGVEFRFFHRLDGLEVDGHSVGAIRLTRQADLAVGCSDYSPLIDVDGLPAWPAAPLSEQLATDPGDGLETHSWEGSGRPVRLEAGKDFDVAVLAVSLGMVPHVAEDLIRSEPRWRDMVQNVATVATRAAQLWFRSTEAELGWEGPVGVTLAGFGDTFDTWASMSHLVEREQWDDEPPRSLAYLCGALRKGDGESEVSNSLVEFLERRARVLWPSTGGDDGFRWELLWDDKQSTGPERLEAQYVRANLDPSDRYVQSLPGTGRYRIPPGDTGFDNLAIAGDWTATGLDAGCIEAAVRSGVMAAEHILAGSAGR